MRDRTDALDDKDIAMNDVKTTLENLNCVSIVVFVVPRPNINTNIVHTT